MTDKKTYVPSKIKIELAILAKLIGDLTLWEVTADELASPLDAYETKKILNEIRQPLLDRHNKLVAEFNYRNFTINIPLDEEFSPHSNLRLFIDRIGETVVVNQNIEIRGFTIPKSTIGKLVSVNAHMDNTCHVEFDNFCADIHVKFLSIPEDYFMPGELRARYYSVT